VSVSISSVEILMNAGVDLQAPVEVDVGPHLWNDTQQVAGRLKIALYTSFKPMSIAIRMDQYPSNGNDTNLDHHLKKVPRLWWVHEFTNAHCKHHDDHSDTVRRYLLAVGATHCNSTSISLRWVDGLPCERSSHSSISASPVEVGVGPHLESDCQRGCTHCCVTNDNVQCEIHTKESAVCLEIQDKPNVSIYYIVTPSDLTAHPP
jgi:hypothetical protein